MPRARRLLTEPELRHLEMAHAATGLTAHQILETFAMRGAPLSEATFRKYVQLGLLPRSRRVGRKGKHLGSQGVYPASTVRRLARVKEMIGDDYTIEEIRGRLARSVEIEALRTTLRGVLASLEGELKPAGAEGRRHGQQPETAALRSDAEALLQRIEALDARLGSQPRRPTVPEPALPPEL